MQFLFQLQDCQLTHWNSLYLQGEAMGGNSAKLAGNEKIVPRRGGAAEGGGDAAEWPERRRRPVTSVPIHRGLG